MKNTLLRMGGFGLLILAAAALFWDVVSPDVPTGTPAAREGFRIGYFIGMGLRTLILGGIGWGLLAASKRPSGASAVQERMRRILEAHRQEVPAARPENGDLYATASDDEVLDVYENIDKQANPERFAALLWAIARRVAKQGGDPGAAG